MKRMQFPDKKIPLAFFAYNRPTHTERSLKALSECYSKEKYDFYFFSDGAKNQDQVANVIEVRKILQDRSNSFSATVIQREKNLGLSKSIVEGVSSLCKKYGWVVVLEDDLEVASNFLNFMAISLEKYQSETEVMQIGGYTIAPPQDLKTDSFFLPITTTWGWGTWERAWNNFSWEPKGWPSQKKDTNWLKLFTVNGAGDYLSMLEGKLCGQNDSWGILWWYAVSVNKGKVLYPVDNLVSNFGFDGSGEHCKKGDFLKEHSTELKILEKVEHHNFPNIMDIRSSDFILLEKKLRKKNLLKILLKNLSTKTKMTNFCAKIGQNFLK